MKEPKQMPKSTTHRYSKQLNSGQKPMLAGMKGNGQAKSSARADAYNMSE